MQEEMPPTELEQMQQIQMQASPQSNRKRSPRRANYQTANARSGQSMSPIKMKSEQQRIQDQKNAEKVYRTLFEGQAKNGGGQQPQMTELGRSIIPGSQIPVATLYKKQLEQFQQEIEDESIAQLHFTHHTNRRTKNLLRLNLMLKMQHGDANQVSMPSLAVPKSSMTVPHTPIDGSQYNTPNPTRNAYGRKNNAAMVGSLTAGSKSMVNRSINNGRGGHSTLLNRDDLNSSLSVVTRPNTMFKSASMNSLGSAEDKLQRSQLNIDRKMREDFDRLQNQLKKRMEKETAAQEQLRYALEERVHKASVFNQKGQVALDKVRLQQRKLELQSVRTYKKNMHEMEERRKKSISQQISITQEGPKDRVERENAAKARENAAFQTNDQTIVEKLYSLEVKLLDRQQKAKNWEDENRIKKAQGFNRRVDEIKEVNTSVGGSLLEQKTLERMGKVVAKQQKINDFSKTKEEEASYINQQRNERAQKSAMRVEQTKKQQKRQHNQVKKQQESKEAQAQVRGANVKQQLDRQVAYRKEVAKLRAEEQQEMRELRQFQQQQQKYQILEKHMNLQQKLEIKKQVIDIKGKAALESSMSQVVARQEEKEERKRQALLAEKNAIKAAKKPKKEPKEPVE